MRVEPPRKTNVGDLMLAAGTRTTAEMDADLFLIGSALGLKLFHEQHHAVLRLGDGQVAELHAGARDAALPEIRGPPR